MLLTNPHPCATLLTWIQLSWVPTVTTPRRITGFLVGDQQAPTTALVYSRSGWARELALRLTQSKTPALCLTQHHQVVKRIKILWTTCRRLRTRPRQKHQKQKLVPTLAVMEMVILILLAKACWFLRRSFQCSFNLFDCVGYWTIVIMTVFLIWMPLKQQLISLFSALLVRK